MGSYPLLTISALAAGLINSVAGWGMFLTFPALVFTGVPSIAANASSTTALIPGIYASAWAYREDFRKSEDFPFVPLLIVSMAGGMVGALLLLFTPQRTFDSVIPWLMLAASLLFTFGSSHHADSEAGISYRASRCRRYSIFHCHLWRLLRRGDWYRDAGDVDRVRHYGHSRYECESNHPGSGSE
jgi:uncharacterized membrane protein YfcA